jgi:hypothetical protein
MPVVLKQQMPSILLPKAHADYVPQTRKANRVIPRICKIVSTERAAARQKLQQRLQALADLNKHRNLRRARAGGSQ